MRRQGAQLVDGSAAHAPTPGTTSARPAVTVLAAGSGRASAPKCLSRRWPQGPICGDLSAGVTLQAHRAALLRTNRWLGRCRRWPRSHAHENGLGRRLAGRPLGSAPGCCLRHCARHPQVLRPTRPTEASRDAMDAETARVPQAEPPLVPHLELHLPLQALPTSWPGQADPELKPCSLSRKIVTYKLPGQSAPACACVQKATAPLASGAAYQSPE